MTTSEPTTDVILKWLFQLEHTYRYVIKDTDLADKINVVERRMEHLHEYYVRSMETYEADKEESKRLKADIKAKNQTIANLRWELEQKEVNP